MNGRQAREATSEGAPGSSRKLLVLDTAFTLEAVRERRLEPSIICRDLGGFFNHVWSVHPFATLLTSDAWGPRYGRPQTYELARRHSLIEGKVGRFASLRGLFVLNFLIAQTALFGSLLRLIRRERISVIRTGSPLYLGLFAWGLARLSGIPFVVRVGGNHDKAFATTGQPMEPRLMRSRRIEKIVERFVFARADLVAGANQDNLDFALANGARPERATLFRYGNLIDPGHFVAPGQRAVETDCLAELAIEPGRFLLYVGRLEPVKQPDHVVETLAHAREKGFDVKAVFAGEGRMRPALVELAQRRGVADHLILAGNVDQRRLAQLYPAAAVIVSPHTGRALSEAALAAAPVVAYDVDWQGEMIVTGATGILVPHGDRHAMAEAVVSLLADPAEARRLGDALRRHALDMLDPEALDGHERREYAKLIAREQPSRSPRLSEDH